jgi:ribose-phosphate pyrophosphokinase
MKPLVVAMPGNEPFADALAAAAGMDRVPVTVRRFPDGESYVRADPLVQGRRVSIACTLDRPDDKLVPLLLLAAAVREAGALSVGLVAPYLAYMRQDQRFHPGETISARHVAAWISRHFDWLTTVDPHLHRIAELSQIYGIASRVVHAGHSVAAWVQSKVRNPLLIGPDEESAQWVGDVASQANAPFVVLRKVRRGDREVEVSVPDVEHWRSHTPVLVDDIVSTARTMIAAVDHLRRAGMAPPVCVAVHAVFAQRAFEDLREAGAGDIVSCDTVAHPTNQISIVPAVAVAVRDLGF